MKIRILTFYILAIVFMSNSVIATQTGDEVDHDIGQNSSIYMPVEIYVHTLSFLDAIDLHVFALTSKSSYKVAETRLPYLPTSLNLACFKKSSSPFMNDTYKSDRVRLFFNLKLIDMNNYVYPSYCMLFEDMKEFCHQHGIQLAVCLEEKNYKNNICYDLTLTEEEIDQQDKELESFLIKKFPKLYQQLHGIKNCLLICQNNYKKSSLIYRAKCLLASEEGFNPEKNYGLKFKEHSMLNHYVSIINFNKTLPPTNFSEIKNVFPITEYYYDQGYKILIKKNKVVMRRIRGNKYF